MSTLGFFGSQNGQTDIVKLLMADPRVDYNQIADLIEKYGRDPFAIRLELRQQPGIR